MWHRVHVLGNLGNVGRGKKDEHQWENVCIYEKKLYFYILFFECGTFRCIVFVSSVPVLIT